MRHTVRRTLLAWAAVLVIAVAFAAGAYSAARESQEAERWVVHTLEVRATLEHLVSRVLAIQSAQRGFALTADERFLDGFRTTQADARLDLDRLAGLTSDNPRQTPRVQALRRVLDEKLAFSERVVADVRAGRRVEAVSAISRREGDELVARLRSTVATMDAEEEALLEVRRAGAISAKRRALVVAGVTIGISLVIAIAATMSALRAARARMHASERIAESEQRFRRLAEAAFEGVVVSDADANVVDCNPALCAMLGFSREQLIGMSAFDFIDRRDHDAARARMTHDGEHEVHLRTATGALRVVEVRARVLDEHGRKLRLAALRDVTERKHQELAARSEYDRVRALSTLDELTGLANRRGFVERAEIALSDGRANALSSAVLFVDLNGMKTINDSFGHDAGDRALADAAQLLSGVARKSDFAARLGGDEFVLFVHDASPTGLEAIARRIDEALVAFNAKKERPFVLSLSIGWTLSPAEDDRSLDALLAEADARMYEEKRKRGNSRSQRHLHAVR